MALKTFNVDEETYRAFSEYCRNAGISMSKKVENFLKSELDKINGNSNSQEAADSPILENKDSHPMEKYC